MSGNATLALPPAKTAAAPVARRDATREQPERPPREQPGRPIERSSEPENPPQPPRPRCRRFTAQEKLRVLGEADRAACGLNEPAPREQRRGF
jgi:hypothetical protein